MDRSGLNNLKIEAYSSGNSPVDNDELTMAQGLSFGTYYPGGLFGNCAFFIPRDVTKVWPVKEGQRIKVKNGLKTVWEGKIIMPGLLNNAVEEGLRIKALGYWGDVLQRRKWRKWWADTRSGQDAWVRQEVASSKEELFEFEQDFGNIHIMPKETNFSNGDFTALRYTMPSGETIKRITYSYDFQEDVQQWEMLVWDVTAGAAVAGSSVTVSGTGSHDLTLATPRQVVELRLYSRANQAADLNKHVHAQWNNITVYSETGSINLTEIAKDVRGRVSELSASEKLIGSNSFSLVPFISETDWLSDILTNAAHYGDTSFNAWAVGIRESDLGIDDKPVLFVEQFPTLTDFDYAVRLDEPNLVPPFEATRDLTDVVNWVAVEFTDQSGNTIFVTPDDDANLKDANSIAAYGERQEWLNVQTTSQTAAVNYGRRYLAQRKDPQWTVSSGIQVVGYVRGKGGQIVPSSEIRAGKRIRVENFLQDLSGTGLTFLITATNYNDERETCSISVGLPSSLDVWLAQQFGV